MGIDDVKRWSRIDEMEIGLYPHLCRDDLCFYYLERSRGTWEKGEANRIVSNFQKDVEKYHDRPDVLRHKSDAIKFFAHKISRLVAKKQRDYPVVIVPMITSLPKKAKWHDDRLQRTAQILANERAGEVVVCDILDVREAMEKSKLGGSRHPSVISDYLVTETPDYPDADVVFLIDDVVTTGGHFAACRDAIRPLFPHAQIVGVFLARQKQGYEYGVVEF